MSSLRFAGRWLEFHEIAFTDAHGAAKTWECIRRRGAHGACSIVARTRGPEPRIALVRQFRPPLDAWILEFPAGLIEAGGGVAATALRELREETGCGGTVLAVGPFVYNTPGMTDEKVALVSVLIDDVGAARPEADEQIELVWAPLRGLEAFLRAREEEGTRIDGKLWSFAAGLTLAATLSEPASA